MEEEKGPLLVKKVVYWDDCPGCRIDQKKELQKGIPVMEFVILGMVVISNCLFLYLYFVWFTSPTDYLNPKGLPLTCLFPFMYFMVRDFNVAKRVEDIGYYAGYVGATFTLGKFLTSVTWGIIADKFGRKPALVVGTFSMVILCIPLGLCTNFWIAIVLWFLLGCFDGTFVPVKAFVVEICQEDFQALGLSFVGAAYGIALVIGPVIGGFLAQPAESFPRVFSKTSLFGRFPYFLPCLVISVIGSVALVACFFIPETLHKHRVKADRLGLYEEMESSSESLQKVTFEENDTEADSQLKKSCLTTWPLISSVIIYCLVAFFDVTFGEIFSLWTVSPRKYGGLEFSTHDVGVLSSVSGLVLVVFQLFIFPSVEKSLGPIVVVRLATLLMIPLLVTYPFIAKQSGSILFLSIYSTTLLRSMFSGAMNMGLFIQQNNAVSQHQRGAANGIVSTGASFVRIFGPALGGASFAWAQKRQDATLLPGNQILFFILDSVSSPSYLNH